MKLFLYNIVGMILFSGSVFGQKSQIIHEGCICLDSISVNQTLNWYALIKTEKVFYYILRPIKISIESMNDCDLESLKIKTNIKSKSIYLIGTNDNWKEKEIYSPYNWNNGAGVDITKTSIDIYSVNLKNNQESTSNQLYTFGNNGFDGFGIIGKTSKGQEVTQELQDNFELENLKKNGLHLEWFGDLDGDNKTDLILNTSTDGEKGSFKFLFLTSKAKKNEVIGKAGETNIGYCN